MTNSGPAGFRYSPAPTPLSGKESFCNLPNPSVSVAGLVKLFKAEVRVLSQTCHTWLWF